MPAKKGPESSPESLDSFSDSRSSFLREEGELLLNPNIPENVAKLLKLSNNCFDKKTEVFEEQELNDLDDLIQ